MNIDDLWCPLQNLAKELRPVTRSSFLPLLKLVDDLGLDAELRFYSSGKIREAQSEINSARPRIYLYRKASANGGIKLTPEMEHLLSPRERFSLAHELGHCLAFKNFGAPPILKKADPREYRRQERCMDEFAQALLVPDWLAQEWLSQISNETPVSLSMLRTWASVSCRVSNEVVARGLTKFEPNIGFLKTAEAVRLSNDKRLFIVFDSSYGAKLKLPNLHSFIDDEAFIKKICSPSGSSWIGDCLLGKTKCERLSVAWKESSVSTARRRKEFGLTVKLSGKGYWISIRSGHGNIHRLETDRAQLTLFD